MSKKVLILSGSPRKGGNSDLLCDEFMRGAVEAGNEVTKIRAAEKKIGYCSACYYCRKSSGVCAKKDDIGEMDLLTIGTINDMYTEMQNDENQGAYSTLASQDDMDRF